MGEKIGVPLYKSDISVSHWIRSIKQFNDEDPSFGNYGQICETWGDKLKSYTEQGRTLSLFLQWTLAILWQINFVWMAKEITATSSFGPMQAGSSGGRIWALLWYLPTVQMIYWSSNRKVLLIHTVIGVLRETHALVPTAMRPTPHWLAWLYPPLLLI